MFLQRLQDHFTYHPERAVHSDTSEFQLEEQFLPASFGTMHVVYSLKNESAPVLLFSHGNSSSVQSLAPTFHFYKRLGVNFLAYDYPGYGKSEGVPSEAGLIESFRRAFAYLQDCHEVSAERIVVHGLSLGGAVSIQVLQDVEVKGAILESTFTSAKAMAQHKFPYMPFVDSLVSGYDSKAVISRCKSEILFMHGTLDTIIPPEHSEQLFTASTAPACFYRILGAGHRDQREKGGEQYFQIVQQFIEHGVSRFEAQADFLFVRNS